MTAKTGRTPRRQALGLWMNGGFVGTWRMDASAGDILEYDAGWQAAPHGRLNRPAFSGGHFV